MSVPSDPRIYPRPAVFNQVIEFYWQPPSSDGGSNISSYILECSNIGFISVLPSTSRKARVDNLPNQRNYLFTLKATNSFGNSNIASFRSVQPGFPPELPSNLNVVIDLANSEPLLNVSLTQPNTTNSSNITYNALTMYPLDNTGNIIENSPFMFKRFSLPGLFEPVTLIDTNTDYEYRGLIQSINDVRWSKNLTYYNFRINPNLPTNNLKLWLDPYDTSVLTLSNNKVIKWNDKSLNQSNATISETFAPTYDSTNDLLIFNGTQYMNLPANTIPSANTPYSMFIYASASNINLSNLWLLFSGSQSANLSLGAKFNNGNIIQSWFGTDLTGNLANFTATVNLPLLSTFTYDGNIRRTYVNGVLINSEIATNRNSGSSNNIIGSISTLNANLIGSIGDIILYDRLLTDRERTSLETYLINKRSNLSLKNYGNLTLWLDAMDNNTLYNSNINEKISYHNPVSVWLDKSNNNNHAFQSNLSIAPLKKSTLGRDSLNFNSGYMISNIATLPFDAFLIIQLNNLSNINDVIGISPVSNNYNSLSYNITANRWSNDSTSNTFISSNIETSTGYIMMEYSLANNNAFIRRYGSNIANITNFNWSLPNNSRLYIGNDNGITFNNSLKGNIGEIIMFNKQLNDNERFPIEGYLAWKWGISNSLPSTHMFYNNAPSLFSILSSKSQIISIPGINKVIDGVTYTLIMAHRAFRYPTSPYPGPSDIFFRNMFTTGYNTQLTQLSDIWTLTDTNNYVNDKLLLLNCNGYLMEAYNYNGTQFPVWASFDTSSHTWQSLQTKNLVYNGKASGITVSNSKLYASVDTSAPRTVAYTSFLTTSVNGPGSSDWSTDSGDTIFMGISTKNYQDGDGYDTTFNSLSGTSIGVALSDGSGNNITMATYARRSGGYYHCTAVSDSTGISTSRGGHGGGDSSGFFLVWGKF